MSARLELVIAPIRLMRRAIVWWSVGLVAVIAGLLATAVLAVVVAVAQLAADALVDLRIETSYLLSTIVLCTLLAAAHGGLAVALAGIRPRPSMVLGIGIGVAIVGYLIAALLPLSDLLAPWRHLSPWDWAFGGNPLVGPSEAWRYIALALTAIVLVRIGILAVRRRDISVG